MLQVYTGKGKGKTTAALGLALRSLGHGKRVFLVQFMKQKQGCGELKAAKRFKRFKVLQVGRKGWVIKGKPNLKDKNLAQKGLSAAREALKDRSFDLLILDELNVAVKFGLLSLKKVEQLLRDVPDELEVVVTGRDAHREIIKIAHLVSEIRELKHYYKKGIPARAGIEY